MGNFAENLNLGNRFRPPLLNFRLSQSALYIVWSFRNATLVYAYICNPYGLHYFYVIS